MHLFASFAKKLLCSFVQAIFVQLLCQKVQAGEDVGVYVGVHKPVDALCRFIA